MSRMSNSMPSVCQKTEVALGPTNPSDTSNKHVSRRQRFNLILLFALRSTCGEFVPCSTDWNNLLGSCNKTAGPFGRIWAGRCWSTSSLRVHASFRFMRVWIWSFVSFPTLSHHVPIHKDTARKIKTIHRLACDVMVETASAAGFVRARTFWAGGPAEWFTTFSVHSKQEQEIYEDGLTNPAWWIWSA